MVQNIRVPYLSVRKSVLWQNGWLDPDAVWGGERGPSRDGCISLLDWGGDRRRGRGSFGGEFGASYCNEWDLCKALFSNYFENLLYPATVCYILHWNFHKSLFDFYEKLTDHLLSSSAAGTENGTLPTQLNPWLSSLASISVIQNRITCLHTAFHLIIKLRYIEGRAATIHKPLACTACTFS